MSVDYKSRLKEMFNDVFQSPEYNEEVIGQYFSPDYQQLVDAHQIDFEGFKQHVQAQKKRVERVSFTFKSLVCENNIVATIHLIDAQTKEGNTVKGKVMAQFTFEDDKIVACEELTFISEASEHDKDLGHVK